MILQDFLITYIPNEGYMLYTPYSDLYSVECEELLGEGPVVREDISGIRNYEDGDIDGPNQYRFQNIFFGNLGNGVSTPTLLTDYTFIIKRYDEYFSPSEEEPIELDEGNNIIGNVQIVVEPQAVDSFIGVVQFEEIETIEGLYIGNKTDYLISSEEPEEEDSDEVIIEDKDLPYDKYTSIQVNIEDEYYVNFSSEPILKLDYSEDEVNIYNLYVGSNRYFYDFNIFVNKTITDINSYFLEASDIDERIYIKNTFQNNEFISSEFKILTSLFFNEFNITELKILISKSEDVLIKELEGAALISFGRENSSGDIDNNYGIAINSSDDYLALPARAISLFKTQIHPNSTIKVSYDYQGILGTLPPLTSDKVKNSGIYEHMEGTQGIFTNNMYIGDNNQYIAFYTDENGEKQLKIKANQIVYEVVDEDTGESDWKDVSNITQGLDGGDAIQVDVDSTAGILFINNNITSTLVCTVKKGGVDITNDPNFNIYYTWRKRLLDGSGYDTNWGRPLEHGNQIQITSQDVAVKGIFECEVVIQEV